MLEEDQTEGSSKARMSKQSSCLIHSLYSGGGEPGICRKLLATLSAPPLLGFIVFKIM